jgi:hypothetical protein
MSAHVPRALRTHALTIGATLLSIGSVRIAAMETDRSLVDLTLAENERLWAAEAARRYQELKAGTAKSVPSAEVFAKLEARMRR